MTMTNIQGIVFDLYGTLFDVHSVVQTCERFFPGRGREVSALWRQKQLEYTWLRSLIGQYISFEEATADALAFVCRQLGLQLNLVSRAELCDAYLRLEPFPEVPDALRALRALGLPLAILSNGSNHSIHAVVNNAGLASQFAHLISVEIAQVFKPHQTVYALAERALGLPRSNILFVSSNSWDATGAGHFGYPTCWVNRSGNAFEEMGQRPTHTVMGVDQIAQLVNGPPSSQMPSR